MCIGFHVPPCDTATKIWAQLTGFIVAISLSVSIPTMAIICRQHIYSTAYAKQLRKAVILSGIAKRVTTHTFRHAFASNLLLEGSDIRTVQELLGHVDIRMTEIYTYMIGNSQAGTSSPIDTLIINT
ncbi:hypothetical protein AB835_00285 [Candidatus Endobugula sertula]|uniref:Tyr recombinase domain-containing protein n=1 Tax=Candidatus Endobugula sertula TaxID=62101 RepID=A0A1D2QTW1_9GAMM|nr:hypothetical protein AB835_00285 [Candidatus Endobugula sertula]